MFDSIRGRLLRSEPMRAVVDANGIGYEIRIPLSTYEAMPRPESEVELLVHPWVRENDWRLFGFGTSGEREVFRALLRVSGVGPTLALGLLSGLTPAEFRVAVTQADVAALTRVKGIGKKTAERILVELKDIVEQTLADQGAVGVDAETRSTADDAIHALAALGLPPSEARRRVERQLQKLAEPTVTDLVRAALRAS